MTLYSIYAKTNGTPSDIKVVNQGFNVVAFIFGPFWAISKAAFWYLPLYIGAYCVIAYVLLQSNFMLAYGLNATLAIFTGFTASSFVDYALRRRDWLFRADIEAPDAGTAEAVYFAKTYGLQE